MRSSFASIPTTQFLVNERAPSARRRIDWRRFLIMTGLNTLSCFKEREKKKKSVSQWGETSTNDSNVDRRGAS